MKVLASLSRVVFSLIVLIALACYLQNEPTISLENFCASITPEQLLNLLNNFNTVSLLFVVILLLGMLPFTRVLEAVWNVVFCASVLLLLAIGLYETGGPLIALPKAAPEDGDVGTRQPLPPGPEMHMGPSVCQIPEEIPRGSSCGPDSKYRSSSVHAPHRPETCTRDRTSVDSGFP